MKRKPAEARGEKMQTLTRITKRLCKPATRELTPQNTTARGVALVLSGGGARVFAHIGVLRALEEARIPIEQIGGTSGGALIAAQVALGWDAERIRQRCAAILSSAARRSITSCRLSRWLTANTCG